MREESQLEDMRSAIRGDFERLVERRGEQVLMRVSELEPVAEVEVEVEVEVETVQEETPRRSWLARFVSP